MVVNYIKPKAITVALTTMEQEWLKQPRDLFIQSYIDYIDRTLEKFQLVIRKAFVEDIKMIQQFIHEHYPLAKSSWVTVYDIFRMTKFGNGILICDAQNQIKACLFEIGYDTPDRTSYSVRLLVHPGLSGNNIGILLSQYGCLLAMKRGSRVKRALIDCQNIKQLYIQLNRIGWICDHFYANIDGLVPNFTACLPLTPSGLLENRVDKEKTAHFIQTHTRGLDFELIPVSRTDILEINLSNDEFALVGILRSTPEDPEDYYFTMANRWLAVEQV